MMNKSLITILLFLYSTGNVFSLPPGWPALPNTQIIKIEENDSNGNPTETINLGDGTEIIRDEEKDEDIIRVHEKVGDRDVVKTIEVDGDNDDDVIDELEKALDGHPNNHKHHQHTGNGNSNIANKSESHEGSHNPTMTANDDVINITQFINMDQDQPTGGHASEPQEVINLSQNVTVDEEDGKRPGHKGTDEESVTVSQNVKVDEEGGKRPGHKGADEESITVSQNVKVDEEDDKRPGHKGADEESVTVSQNVKVDEEDGKRPGRKGADEDSVTVSQNVKVDEEGGKRPGHKGADEDSVVVSQSFELDEETGKGKPASHGGNKHNQRVTIEEDHPVAKPQDKLNRELKHINEELKLIEAAHTDEKRGSRKSSKDDDDDDDITIKQSVEVDDED